MTHFMNRKYTIYEEILKFDEFELQISQQKILVNFARSIKEEY